MLQQLSQFWYNDDTIKALVRGALNSTPANGKIALVSCPSLYSRLKKECGERQSMTDICILNILTKFASIYYFNCSRAVRVRRSF